MPDKKKTFRNNPALGFISAAAQEAQEAHGAHDTQGTPHTQEAQESRSTRRQKLARINMAFSDQNIEYLRRISRLRGVSQTEYVNSLIDADREKNQGLIGQLDALLGENQ